MNTVSDSTLQLPFKKLPLVKFWCNIKDKYPQLTERLLKYFLPLHHVSAGDKLFRDLKGSHCRRLNSEPTKKPIVFYSARQEESCKNLSVNATLLSGGFLP